MTCLHAALLARAHAWHPCAGRAPLRGNKSQIALETSSRVAWAAFVGWRSLRGVGPASPVALGELYRTGPVP